MEEKWVNVNIKGLQDRYKISNYGRVYSIKRKQIISIQKQSNRYIVYMTNNRKEQRAFEIRRLVANHFVKNENPVLNNAVDYIDGNDQNFRADNLIWCQVNQTHSFKNFIATRGYVSKKGKATILEQNGKEYEFRTIAETSDFLKVTPPTIENAVKYNRKIKGYNVYFKGE